MYVIFLTLLLLINLLYVPFVLFLKDSSFPAPLPFSVLYDQKTSLIFFLTPLPKVLVSPLDVL